MPNKKRTQSRRQSGHNQKDKVMAKEINKTYQKTQDSVPEKKPIKVLGTQIPSNTRDRIVIGVGISAIMIIIVLFLIL